jgi:hypothetical protein
MNHISEEQLVLFYYGESAEAGAIEEHLSVCESCRAELRGLQVVLNTVNCAPIPEREAGYGQALWKRIEPQIPARGRRAAERWWIWAPVMAGLLLAAFLAGSLWQRRGTAVAARNQDANQIRERILLVAVGEHVERSLMVLAEIENAPDGKGKLDISGEQQMAEDLLDDNRLYRLTARTTGDQSTASVLDDLERVLLEIAHSPSELSGDQLRQLQGEIQSQGVLFKVRVLGSKARDAQAHPSPPKETSSKKL